MGKNYNGSLPGISPERVADAHLVVQPVSLSGPTHVSTGDAYQR